MLNRFFWMCSGADPDILKDSPKSERIKYAGVGGTVFFTAVMAFIAGSYALYTVFDNYWIAITFGLVWGLLIFNLDRFIVSTIKKQGNFGKELLQAAPRIVLAIIIAMVISKPLEMKIFQKEIDRVLLEQKNEMTLQNQGQIALQFTPEIERLEAENRALNLAVTQKEIEVNQLYDTYITEAEGTQGTMKIGKGPVYKEKREKHDSQLQDLQQLRMENREKVAVNEAQIVQLRLDQTEKTSETQPIIDGFDGLMARISALDLLPLLPRLFIFFLFIAIETAPVFAKLIAPKGAYDLKFDDQELLLEVWVTQKKRQRAELLAADTEINEKSYGDVTKEEEPYLERKQTVRELLRLQSEAFFKEQEKLI